MKSCCNDKTMTLSQSEEPTGIYNTRRQKQKQEAQKTTVNKEPEKTVKNN